MIAPLCGNDAPFERPDHGTMEERKRAARYRGRHGASVDLCHEAPRQLRLARALELDVAADFYVLGAAKTTCSSLQAHDRYRPAPTWRIWPEHLVPLALERAQRPLQRYFVACGCERFTLRQQLMRLDIQHVRDV